MLSAITEVTRSAQKASRGLVSIGSRLVQVLDDQSSTGAALRDIYDELGIALFDNEGQLRSSYDIFSDLAEIWDTLDANTQNYIASQQAGTNQFQNFAALLSNFDTAAEATNTALNSMGSATRENARYMESLNAKTSQLKSTFQELSNNVINSDLVATILDVANAFLQLANTPIGTFVTQAGLLTGVMTGILAIAPNFTKVFGAVGTAFTAASQGASGFMGVLKGLGGVFSTVLGKAALIGTGISLLVNLFGAIKNAWQEAHPTVEMLDEDITNLNSEIETNQARIEELEAIGWPDRTTAQEAELNNLKEQNEELEKQLALLREERAETWGEEKVTSDKRYKFIDTYYNDPMLAVTSDLDDTIYNSMEDIQAALDASEELTQAFEDGRITIHEYTEELSKTDYVTELTNELRALWIQQANGVELTADQKARMQELVEILTPYLSELEAMNDGVTLQNAGLSDLLTLLDGTISGINEMNLENRMLSEGLKITQAQYDTLLETYPELAEQIYEVNGAYYAEGDAILDLATKNKEAALAIIEQNRERLQNTIDTIQGEIQALGIAARFYNGLGAGVEASNQFKSLYGDLSDTKDALAALDELEAAINAMPDVSVDTDTGTSSSKEQTLIDLLKEELELLDHQAFLMEKNGEDQLQMVAIYQQAQQKIHDLAEQYRRMGYAETSEEIRELQKLWRNYQDEIDAVNQAIEESNAQAAEQAKKDWEEAQQALIDDLEDRRDAYETAFNYMVDQIDKEIEALQEQRDQEEDYWDAKIEALQNQNDEIERQIELEQLQEQLARARSSKVLVFKDGRFQYAQNETEIAEAEKNLEEYEREQALQQEVDNLEQLKQQALDNIDEQIKGWEDYKEAWSSVVDDYQEEQDKLIAEQILGIELEGENWKTRLDNLEQYIDEYKALMRELTEAQNAVYEAQSSGGGGGRDDDDNYYFADDGNTAWIPGVGNVHVDIEDGKTTTTGLPVGTIVKPGDTDREWEITGVNPDGSYQSKEVTKKHAAGTLSAPGGLSLVGENGPELRILNQGDGIVPANVTKNLWELGKYSLKDILNAGQNVTYNMFDKLILPNVTDFNSFVNEIKKFKQFAFQN